FGELETNLIRVVDVRDDRDLRADVLALRLEATEPQAAAEKPERRRRSRARCAGDRSQAREAADVRLKRQVLAERELGPEVVRGEDVRGGEDVRVGVRRERVHDDAERWDREARDEVGRARDVLAAHTDGEGVELARETGDRLLDVVAAVDEGGVGIRVGEWL